MGSTEIVMSSVRPSVRPFVRLSVRLCAIFRPLLHLENWNFKHKSVGVCVSLVRPGILDPWPRSSRFEPKPGPSPKTIRFSEHYLSSCYQNWICESSFKRSQHQKCFLYWTHGHLRPWPTPNPAKVPNFQYRVWLYSMDQKIHGDDKKNPRISILRLGPMSYGHNPAKVPKFKFKAWWYSRSEISCWW
jgi:hypothetical protein